MIGITTPSALVMHPVTRRALAPVAEPCPALRRDRRGGTPSSRVGSGQEHGSAEPRPTFAAPLVNRVGLRCRAADAFVRDPRGRRMGRRGSTALPADGSASPRPGGLPAPLLALLLPWLLCLPWFPARAQVVADGATNTLDNVTNIVAGNAVVGTNGSFTVLILTNGALLTNSGNASIGLNAGANSNAVFVSGSNSRWASGGAFRVGHDGSGIRLVISEGGHGRQRRHRPHWQQCGQQQQPGSGHRHGLALDQRRGAPGGNERPRESAGGK